MPRLAALAALAVLVVTSACHRPSFGPRSLGKRLGDMGGRVVAVVKPVAPRVQVQVDARAIAAAAAHQSGHHQVGNVLDGQPIQVSHRVTGRSVDRGRDVERPAPGPAPDRERPAPSPAPIPTTITRTTTTGPKLVAIARMTTRNNKRSCTVYDTMQQCTTECTNQLKMGAFSTDPNTLQSCTCMEGSGC